MNDLTGHIKGWLSKAFNLPILQKNRMPWVDYLRGIAIILIIYRHGLIGIGRTGIPIPDYLVRANMIFYSFRMPLFFIISGIFISRSMEKTSVPKLLFNKFENLLYPYFIWAFIQVTLQIILIKYVNSDRGLIDYTYILYQPRVLDQFWYLPALFNTTCIYILVKAKLKASAWMQLIVGLILYFVSPFFREISMISDWMEFYVFFAMGDIISKFFLDGSSKRFFNNPYTLALVLPVFFLVQLFYLQQPEEYYYNGVLGSIEFLLIALIGCLSMFVLAFRLQYWNILRFLRVIGYHSLYIYMMHVLVIAFVRIVLTNFLGVHQPLILLFCGIISGIILPIIFYNFMIRENIGWFLFSLHKPVAATGVSQPANVKASREVNSKDK
jgi:fucose 4-O-acetylase-like acetyltransferase